MCEYLAQSNLMRLHSCSVLYPYVVLCLVEQRVCVCVCVYLEILSDFNSIIAFQCTLLRRTLLTSQRQVSSAALQDSPTSQVLQ